ncbi:hypothetical protein K1W54_04700 [Micromonospora sp. CPCC 205371]|nr:hypothetical protein [Micromonospora sp. CPCC 205371]
MTAAELKERQERWLACHRQQVEARRQRREDADACCADCGPAGRATPLARARHHATLADQYAENARKHATEAARAAARVRRSYVIGTAITVPLALLTLALSLVVLFGGGG